MQDLCGCHHWCRSKYCLDPQDRDKFDCMVYLGIDPKSDEFDTKIKEWIFQGKVPTADVPAAGG